MLRYIRGNLHLPLIIMPDILSAIKFRVCVSFAAHPDYKGHTGAMMSMGSGSIMDLSWKQKINGRKSIEDEIVGVDDALPQCFWSRYFIERH